MSSTRKLLIAAGAVAVVVAMVAGAGELGLAPDTLVRTDSQTSVEGTISSIDGTVIKVLGGQIAIDISTARVVVGGDGAVPPKRDDAAPTVNIAVGDRVTALVDVPTAAGQPLVGRFVSVSHPREGTLSGLVQALDFGARTFTVANQVVGVDGQTAYGGTTARGAVSKLEDLAAGDRVFVVLALANGKLLASRLDAFAPPIPLTTFAGTVESIGSTSWTVSGRIVLVTGETKIADSPQVGDTVQVVARTNELGVLVALSIVKVSPRPTAPPPTKPPDPTRTPGQGNKVEFRGIVEAMPEARIGTWVVSGRKVEVDPATIIVGDPHLRDTVAVEGYMGFVSIAATKIAKVDVVISR